MPARAGTSHRQGADHHLVVHDVRLEENLLLVKGAVPGPKNGYVEVREEIR